MRPESGGIVRELRSHWRDDIRPPVRRALTASLSLALLGVAAGVAGDVVGWWDHVPFLTNFATGLTGALFGVPFALVVVGMITKRQVEEADRRAARSAANRLAGDAVASLAAAGGRIVLPGAQDGPLHALAHLLQSYAADDPLPTGTVPFRERPEFRQAALAALDRCDEVAVALDLVVPSADEAGRAWAEACTAWRFLEAHVRPRLREAELAWLTEGQVAELDRLLRPSNPPVLALLVLRELVVDGLAVALETAVDAAFSRDLTESHLRALAAEKAVRDRLDAAVEDVVHLVRTLDLLAQAQRSIAPTPTPAAVVPQP